MLDDGTVHGFVQPMLDCALIWAEQNAPRPAFPYATLRWLRSEEGSRPIARPWYGAVNADGLMVVETPMQDTLEIQVFGPSALNTLDTLRQRLGFPTTQDNAFLHGIAVLSCGPVLNISALLETTWEERAAMELTLGHVMRGADAVGLIEKVQATGTLPGGGAPVPLSLNIEMETPHG
ncbi:Phage-related protein [Granulibacter bethesdensis]|uniref:phage neck terminator protein n=1 Tax=Granulibacter bethesdensis TaxID=364410 RepID=UPI00090A6ED7|nr:hypothetical protein [Granulibacter bethesdensis]APH57398.1 Phage-related protein [Granulibacter bethesdensis]